MQSPGIPFFSTKISAKMTTFEELNKPKITFFGYSGNVVRSTLCGSKHIRPLRLREKRPETQILNGDNIIQT